MSKKISGCVLPLILALLGGCRGTSVDAAYDETVDFSKVRTFDWLNAPPEAVTAVREASLLAAIEKTILGKGLQRTSDKPDVLVAVHRTIEGSLNTKHSGYEVKDGRLARYTLQEGTLVVDLVSATSKASVWRGTAHGAFRADLLPAEREKLLADLLADMFADFPPKR